MVNWARKNWFDAVGIAAGLAATILAALTAKSVVQWTGWPAVLPGILTAVLLAATSFRSMRGNSAAERAARAQRECLPLLGPAVVEVAAAAGISPLLLGGNVYRAKRGRLRRIFRLRLKGPAASKIKWTRGKGCIGMAFQTGDVVYESWSDEERRAQQKGTYPYSRTTERAFSENDKRALQSSYAEVLALPIRDQTGAVIGVVSIDRPGAWKDATPNVLASADIRDLADVLARQLSEPVSRA